MKLFRFRGGVHPAGHKQPTGGKAIRSMAVPRRLYVPVQQHIGAPAKAMVEVGQNVLKGELLAHNQGALSAPVHAPSSGVILDISEQTAPHPSGLPVLTITIETDGKDTWCETTPINNPFALAPEEIATRVGAAGIVGLGGATFPSAVKLNMGKEFPIHTLVLNGGECEPYLTCDDRLMQERANDIIDGIRIMLHALQTPKALVAIEDNKPDAIEAMKIASKLFDNVSIITVPSHYPMGSEKQMIQTLTGMEIPAGQRSADIGIIVHNVGTAYAVHQAIRKGYPLISRIVTVGGGAVKNPQNLEVRLGTLVSEVFSYCDGFKEDPERMLMGGPMMGQVLPSLLVPIVKGSSGVIALTSKEIAMSYSKPCISCGSCVQACPCGLLPLEMAARARKGEFDAAVDFGLMDCISCGSCSYVCPSQIPLVQFFNYAKGELAARRRDQIKNEATRKLADDRLLRLEKIKQEKAEMAAKRKAIRDAKLKAKAEAEAQKEAAS